MHFHYLKGSALVPKGFRKEMVNLLRHDVILQPKICGLAQKENFAPGDFGSARDSSSDHFSRCWGAIKISELDQASLFCKI